MTGQSLSLSAVRYLTYLCHEQARVCGYNKNYIALIVLICFTSTRLTDPTAFPNIV